MALGVARVVQTRVLIYTLIPVVAATSLACMILAETAGLVQFFLYGFVPFALCSVFGMHLLLCRNPRERRAVEFFGLIALSGVIVITSVLGIERRSLVLDAGVALAIISIVFQVKFLLASKGPTRSLRVTRLQETLIVPAAVVTTPFFLWVSSSLNPTFDMHLFVYEASYGFQPSALAVSVVQSAPGAGRILQAAYDGLPLAVALLHAARSRHAPGESFLVIFVVATVIGFALYFVFPVAGVLQLFGEAFPHALPDAADVEIAPVRIDLVAPRNGMPSLHAAWAYLIWLNAQGLPAWMRRAFRVFVVATLAATIGLHDAHWLTDLFVALPMAIALQAAFTTNVPWRSVERWRAVAGGTVLVLVWFAILRFGVPVVLAIPGLAWALAAASSAASVLL